MAVVVGTSPLTDVGGFVGLGVAKGVEVFTVVVGGLVFKVGGGGQQWRHWRW